MNGWQQWLGYGYSIAAAAVATGVGFLMTPRFDLVNVAMIYLLAVVVIALRFTRGAAAFTALLCVAAFDYLFVPPRGTFTVDDVQYLLTFAIMLAVAFIISRLTESVRREAQARTRLGVEAETERIRSALLASISHDLRTPLAVMSGASSSLVERGESLAPAERQALAKSVFDQSREMSERVAKVLQMTRLEAGGIELARDWASLGEIVGAVLRQQHERLERHRVMLEVPGDLPLLRVDAALLEQALGNLVENAGRHTPPETVVRIRAWCSEREVVVSVESFGADLPDEELERVFAKFHRGSMEGSGGLGLGLAICRAIVKLHGGRAWAERLDGGGTAFRFTIPLEKAPTMSSEAELAR